MYTYTYDIDTVICIWKHHCLFGSVLEIKPKALCMLAQGSSATEPFPQSPRICEHHKSECLKSHRLKALFCWLWSMYFGSKNALSFCYFKSSSEIVKLPFGKHHSQKAREVGGEAQWWDFQACVWGPEFVSSTAERKTAKWRPGTSVPKVRPGHMCLKDRSKYEHQI